MAALAALLPELEHVIEQGSAARRAETAARVTQLFVHGAPQFSEAQVDIFDEVLGRLVDDIEARAAAEVARALAPIGNAPPELVRRLAQSEQVAVAGPLLARSPRLREPDLVAVARTQGQAHLLALSTRPAVGTPVTDVLMRRGERAVVRSLAGNTSARLSEAGYAAMVQRASQDGVLASALGDRPDIPPALFHRLVAQATSVVQVRLMASAPPERQAEIKRVLAQVADEVGQTQRRDYAAARNAIAQLRRSGGLSQQSLVRFASAGEVEHLVAGLSGLSRVPLEAIDRLLLSGKPDPVLILCKAMDFNWSTVEAILALRVAAGGPAMEHAQRQYGRLSAATAQRVMHFWRARPAA
ncbi:MAG: DUF2336 domain-containing protein [Variibacter sp.]|nr:DUF2336 domain-containing protein [Variibacter sp.]